MAKAKKVAKALQEAAHTTGEYTRKAPVELTIIGLDTKDGPEHPLWDPRITLPLDSAMMDSIARDGIIETVKAVQRPEGLVVVNGRRRVMHARAVNKEGHGPVDVPVLIITEGDARKLMRQKEIANRFDVKDDPFTTADNIQRHLDAGETIADVANTFGYTEQSIRNYLAMRTLAPEVQQAVKEQWLQATAALALAPLPAEQQTEVLDEVKADAKASGKKPSVANVQKRVQAKKTGGTAENPELTPKERINKIAEVYREVAKLYTEASEMTKDPFLQEILNKVCRIATGKNVKGLHALITKEEAEAKAAKKGKAA